MKYLKLFENFNQSEIDEICRKYNIKNYTINPDGSIDVDGNVWLSDISLTELPLKFNKVYGSFDCSWNKLTNLEGCPNYVGDNFSCVANKLTSLIGCPNYVGGNFHCNGNKLTSLEGCPDEVRGNFRCGANKLTSLEGPKEIGGEFTCNSNPINFITRLFGDVKIYLEYQETYNFLRKDNKIVRHLLEEALKDYNEYYKKYVSIPTIYKIKGYTYI